MPIWGHTKFLQAVPLLVGVTPAFLILYILAKICCKGRIHSTSVGIETHCAGSLLLYPAQLRPRQSFVLLVMLTQPHDTGLGPWERIP